MFSFWLWPLLVTASHCTNIFSPTNRTVLPTSLYRMTGNVSQHGQDKLSSLYSLTGSNASITYDFGVMTAGLPTLHFGPSTSQNTLGLPGFTCGIGCGGLGIAYSEAARFVGVESDQSTLYSHDDGTYFVPITPNTEYTLPTSHARGSFRYLTLSLPPSAGATDSVQVRLSHLDFTAQPSSTVPSNYSSHFSSSDPLLDQIWHAAAYTLQLCTIQANTSVEHIYALSPTGWSQDARATNLTDMDEYLADGAKRDRNPWAGDLGVALRSAVIYRGEDLTAVKNSLYEMFALQNILGYFPYCGSPLGIEFAAIGSLYGSDTYHLWTIASFAEYVLASGDKDFGHEYWSAVVRGVNAVLPQIDGGLFNGQGTEDWGRIGVGGKNTALNSLLYYTLTILSRTAGYLGESSNWSSTAETIKTTINEQLYDESAGLFFDNTTVAGHQIHPQDGNSLAVHFNVTTKARAETIINKLADRHTRFGAPAPEAPGAISPYVSSLELFADLDTTPSNSQRALSFMREQWGYMLDTFSNSTLIEGYGTDGQLTYPFYPNGSAFISHAHAWATGPLYVLSAHVAGLRAAVFDVPVQDGDWVFQPAVVGSDLRYVSAGFARPQGVFDVSWNLTQASWRAEIEVPESTSGTVYIPVFTSCSYLYLDDQEFHPDNEEYETGFVRVADVSGGRHIIEALF